MRKFIDIIKESYSAGKIHGLDVEEFVEGFVEAMLHSSYDQSDDSGGEPLNKNYDSSDIDHHTMDRIYADCRSFLHSAGPWLTEERFKGARLGSLEQRAGYDFWHTRTGSGVGFWDGDWEGEDGSHTSPGPLTGRARAYGNVDAYIGDDEKIHLA